MLRPTRARLPVEWAIDRVSSFQLTRSARLSLALHTYITMYAPPAHKSCTVTQGKRRRSSKAQVRKLPTVGLMELGRNCCNLLKINSNSEVGVVCHPEPATLSGGRRISAVVFCAQHDSNRAQSLALNRWSPRRVVSACTLLFILSWCLTTFNPTD